MQENKIESFLNNHAIKGFLDHDEGVALYRYALDVSKNGPSLEIGSYCGLSTVYLGEACKVNGMTLYAVDHHRGSEEHQLGEEYHDGDLYDSSISAMDSFPHFRKTLRDAELEDTVVPVVTTSVLARRDWKTPLSMVFIDGGHSEEMAKQDCTGWAQHVMHGGILAIHDIFEHPEDGGQGPYLGMRAVLETGEFTLVEQVKSLALLRKK